MKFKIKVPIFGFDINFSDKPEDVFYTEYDVNSAKDAYGQTGMYRGRGISMYIEPNAPEDTLVHECVHAVGMICAARGIKYNVPPDDEIFAYLVGWLYTTIQKRIRRENEKSSIS